MTQFSKSALHHILLAIAARVFSFFRLGRCIDPAFAGMTMAFDDVWRRTSVEDALNRAAERRESVVAGVPERHEGKKIRQVGALS